LQRPVAKLELEHSSLQNDSPPRDKSYPGPGISTSLARIASAEESQLNRNAAFGELREMVLNSVASNKSKRNYAKAVDDLFAFCASRPLSLVRS
jgi:hypothetical protein